jgi:hypothetical protein
MPSLKENLAAAAEQLKGKGGLEQLSRSVKISERIEQLVQGKREEALAAIEELRSEAKIDERIHQRLIDEVGIANAPDETGAEAAE